MARVIIVDDEKIFRSLMIGVLRRAGHVVTAFDDADAALREIDNIGADLLVTDLFMPGKDGLETIREVRRRWPGLPVVAVSGGGTGQFGGPGDFLGFARTFGAFAVLSKPFRAEALLGVVGAALASADAPARTQPVTASGAPSGIG